MMMELCVWAMWPILPTPDAIGKRDIGHYRVWLGTVSG